MAPLVASLLVLAPARGAFPGTNGKLAFESTRDGNSEIYLMNADGSGQTNITNNADFDGEPQWSPDGSKIAFQSNRDGNFEVYVMNADGSGQTNITNNAAFDGEPHWSGGGSQITFETDRDGNFEVYVMDEDGMGPTNLSNNAAADEAPAWSPDNTTISFGSTRDANFEIYVMNDDGSAPTNLTNNPAAEEAPAWSPDGTKISFGSTRAGNFDVFVMNQDGSAPTNLTNNAASDTDPSWQPIPAPPPAPPPPPPGPDLFASGLEITQGIQQLVLERPDSGGPEPFFRAYRGTPLVEGRPTVVRLYGGVENTSQPVHNVTALLYGSDGSTPLPQSPLAPTNLPVAVAPTTPLSAQRRNADLSWNFELPPSWTDHNVRLRLVGRVNAGGSPDILECPGCDDPANSLGAEPDGFRPTGALVVIPYQVRWGPPCILPRFSSCPPAPLTFAGNHSAAFDFARATFPLEPQTDVVVYPYGSEVTIRSKSCSVLLEQLSYVAANSTALRQGAPLMKKRIAVGILPNIPGLDRSGCAYLSSDYAVARGDLAETVAHEAGHNFGLKHASNDHKECDGGGCERDWPFAHGGIGTVGFDVQNMKAIDPGFVDPRASFFGSHAHDLMSYGKDRWISLRNYARLFNKVKLSGPDAFVARAGALGSARAPGLARRPRRSIRPRLFVAGSIAPDGSAATLKAVFRGELAPDDLPRTGPLSLVLLDARGRAIAGRRFEALAPLDDEGNPPRHFFITLPVSRRARRIELRRGTSVLAARARTRHAPRIRLLSPGGARRLRARGSLVVRWRARDADGDALRYIVDYSPDGGRRWQAFGVDLTARSLRLDLAKLMGGRRGVVRVRASDGFNTASARSRPLRVAGKRPLVRISAPARRAVFPASLDPTLRGQAVDLESGVLPPRRLLWRSNRDGTIGRGTALSFIAPSLGNHVMTVTARDRDGATSSARTLIVVRPTNRGDRSRPRVSRRSPRRGARRTRTTTRLRVRFSEEVVGVNLRTVRLVTARGRSVRVRLSYRRATRTVIVKPRHKLTRRTRYRLVLARRITDLAGNRLIAAGSSFRTR